MPYAWQLNLRLAKDSKVMTRSDAQYSGVTSTTTGMVSVAGTVSDTVY